MSCSMAQLHFSMRKSWGSLIESLVRLQPKRAMERKMPSWTILLLTWQYQSLVPSCIFHQNQLADRDLVLQLHIMFADNIVGPNSTNELYGKTHFLSLGSRADHLPRPCHAFCTRNSSWHNPRLVSSKQVSLQLSSKVECWEISVEHSIHAIWRMSSWSWIL